MTPPTGINGIVQFSARPGEPRLHIAVSRLDTPSRDARFSTVPTLSALELQENPSIAMRREIVRCRIDAEIRSMQRTLGCIVGVAATVLDAGLAEYEKAVPLGGL